MRFCRVQPRYDTFTTPHLSASLGRALAEMTGRVFFTCIYVCSKLTGKPILNYSSVRKLLALLCSASRNRNRLLQWKSAERSARRLNKRGGLGTHGCGGAQVCTARSWQRLQVFRSGKQRNLLLWSESPDWVLLSRSRQSIRLYERHRARQLYFCLLLGWVYQ